MRSLIIGSRGSQLALRQAELVRQALLKNHPGVEIDIQIIKTTGDRMSQTDLSELAASTKGLFVKEIEEALLDKRIDIAVHSLKDLPTELPEKLELGAIPKREDPRDTLVSETVIRSLSVLPPQANIGTSSLRRRLQLQNLRPDLAISPIRGNVDTRISKVAKGHLDGVVLAAAALNRLDLNHLISYTFSVDEMVPAVGQGALALEIRSEESHLRELVLSLDHPSTRICALAERAFLLKMGGGCEVPMGAHAWILNKKAGFTAFVGHPSGSESLRRTAKSTAVDLENLALSTAEDLLAAGAGEFLKELDIENRT